MRPGSGDHFAAGRHPMRSASTVTPRKTIAISSVVPSPQPTGRGGRGIAELLRVPGGSRLLLEALVPYDARALTEFLGFEPPQACSVETAVAMAQRSRERAAKFAPTGALLLGLGATAGLVTDRPRQGEHRCHIAVASTTGTEVSSIVLAKGRRDRATEEDLVARAVVLCLSTGW